VTNYLHLAELLEKAAKALREADEVLKGVPQVRTVTIPNLRLSVRCLKVLNRKDIRTIDRLLDTTPEELLESHNFGMTSLSELREKLAEYGLHLKDDDHYARNLRSQPPAT
jgi:DNA-directed RNA polymerase alpha subunit